MATEEFEYNIHDRREDREEQRDRRDGDQMLIAAREFLTKIAMPGAQDAQRARSPGEVIASNVLAAFMSAPFYPLRFVQVLMQLGYEPVPPQRRYSFIFRRYLYYYPGLFGYAKAIIRQEGWRALYRGLGPGIAENIAVSTTGYFLQPRIAALVDKLPLSVVPEGDGDVPDTEENVETTRAIFVRATKQFLIMSLSAVSGEIVVHPFHVIAVRTIAQHVGHEGVYTSVWGSIKQIYREEGLSGFYAGLVPAILGHVCAAAIHSALWVFFRIFLQVAANSWSAWAKLLVVLVIERPMLAFVPSSYSYPFHLMSTMMAVNNCHLVIGCPPNVPIFHRWSDCYYHLKVSRTLYRGSTWLLPRFAYTTPPKGSLLSD